MNENAYKKKYSSYLAAIDAALETFLPKSQQNYGVVVEAMRYSVLGSGKRVRAILLIEFCKACGGTQKDAMPFACALEMIHAYSLIHDDLPCMDNDALRRGKPSCWKAYGETNALLAGDGLLTKAFEVAASSDVLPQYALSALTELAKSAGNAGMIGGQVLDLQNEGHNVGETALLQMYALKTGALLSCAAKAGCLLSGAPKTQVELAGLYAQKIGLAFQIVDDILDVTGTEEILGKPIGSDAQSKKHTYVTLHGLGIAKEKAQALTQEAQQILKKFSWEDEFLVQLTERLAVRKK